MGNQPMNGGIESIRNLHRTRIYTESITVSNDRNLCIYGESMDTWLSKDDLWIVYRLESSKQAKTYGQLMENRKPMTNEHVWINLTNDGESMDNLRRIY